MERRLFLQALVASVVAAGAPLPVGFPEEWPEDAMDLNQASLEKLLEYDWVQYSIGFAIDKSLL